MNPTRWFVCVLSLVAASFVGCSDGGSKAPEGAGLKGMDNPSSFSPDNPPPASNAPAK